MYTLNLSKKKVLKYCQSTLRILLFLLILVLCFIQIPRPSAWAASVAWIGGTDTNWSTAANWSTGVVPTSNDDVLIDVSTTVNIAAPITVQSLVLGNSSGTTTPILNFNYNAITNGALTISNGSLYLYSGGQITHTAGTSAIVGTVNINISAGNLIIYSGGSINTTGKGYTTGNGAGATGWAGGGAYGATGGGSSGATYGDIKNPVNLGSGGGTASAAGGSGGGAILINVTGILTNNGTITTNGNVGLDDYRLNRTGGGGGSGGTVNISCNTFEGSGSIYAKGGNGGGGDGFNGGGGAGGRIAITYSTKTSSGTISAAGGTGNNHGGPGSVFTKATGTNGNLIYDNTGTANVLSGKGYAIISTAQTFDNVTVRNLSTLEVSSTLTVVNTLSLETTSNLRTLSTANISYTTLSWASTTTILDNGGTMPLLNNNVDFTVPQGTTYIPLIQKTYHNGTVNGTITSLPNSTSEIYKVNLVFTGSLTVSSTGSINVTTKGYISKYGPGVGISIDGWDGGGGGGHGGTGGRGNAGASGGVAYDNIGNPQNIGSAAGTGGKYGVGGTGGGAIIISIAETLTNNGIIAANAGNGYGAGYGSGGGGAGGSININCGTLAGNGQLLAKGGNGVDSWNGLAGGGGGGRIAIATSANNYTGTFNVAGGTGYVAGGVGTIYPNTLTIESTTSSNVTQTTATISSNITAIPINGMSDRGFRYGTDSSLATYTQISKGASNSTGSISTNLTGLKDNTIYYFRVYAISNSVTTLGDIQTFTTLSYNITPTALASDITGADDIYAGKYISIQTIYSDNDGSADLDKLYLQIKNPSGTNIEYYATPTDSNQTGQVSTAVSGSEYVSSITYDTDINSPTNNDITITWHITLNWNWTRATTIQYAVKAVDKYPAESTYEYTTNTYMYENRVTFAGDITAVDSQNNSVAQNDWTIANENITFSGIKVVYFGTTNIYPNDNDFDVKSLNDETDEWFDNTSSGEYISIVATTPNNTNANDTYTFTIVNIPTGGSDVSSTTFTLKTDNTIPTISSLTSTSHTDQETWYTDTKPSITWVVSDSQSGIYKIWRLIDQTKLQSEAKIMYYGIEDTAAGTYQANIVDDGVWYFHLAVMDNMGLTNTKTYKIQIDTQDPEIRTLTSSTHSSQNTWYTNKSAIFTWDSSDTGSGVKRIWKLVDQSSTHTIKEVLAQGTESAFNSTWTTPELPDGTWYLHLAAKDNTDKTTYKQYSLHIDSSIPDIISITGKNNGLWQNVDSGPVISWTDPSSISDDTFYITNDGTIPTSTNYTYNTMSPSYDLPAQEEGETIIRVRALNGAGTYSEIRSYTLKYDKTSPTNVSNLSATSSTSSAVLTWQNPTNSDFNKVLIVRNSLNVPTSITNGIKIYEGNLTSYTDIKLSENTKYYYTVFAFDKIGNQSSGTIAQITTSASTSQPYVPPITEQTKVVTIQDLAKEEAVNVTVNQQQVTTSNSGDIHVYAQQTMDIGIPATTITSNTSNLKDVIFVVADNSYLMRYDSETDSYKTTINVPTIKGAYDTKIQTISNENISELAITMSLMVDPYGYIYSKTWNNETRISDATVYLYKKINDEQTLWTSPNNSTNPQITNSKGEYSFFVEPGEYKIVVKANGYSQVETEWFMVETNIIEKNIKLKRNPYIYFGITLATGIIVAIGIISTVKRKKLLSKINDESI